MAFVEWQNHSIEFIPVLSHKTLWMATKNELRVDGRLLATSGGFVFRSKAEGEFEHRSENVKIEVKSRTYWGAFFDINYEIVINGKTINKAIAKSKIRW